MKGKEDENELHVLDDYAEMIRVGKAVWDFRETDEVEGEAEEVAVEE